MRPESAAKRAARERVGKRGVERREALDALLKADKALTDALRSAHKQKVPVTDLAVLAKLSRPTVYDRLGVKA